MADGQSKAQAQGSNLVIPDEIKQQHPELLQLIVESESMNDEERQYWINILPIMTPDQIQNLRDILLNEKKQLAAIDKKYAKEIEQIGQQQLVKKTEKERRRRREQRSNKEQEAMAEEEALEASLLKQIEEA